MPRKTQKTKPKRPQPEGLRKYQAERRAAKLANTVHSRAIVPYSPVPDLVFDLDDEIVMPSVVSHPMALPSTIKPGRVRSTAGLAAYRRERARVDKLKIQDFKVHHAVLARKRQTMALLKEEEKVLKNEIKKNKAKQTAVKKIKTVKKARKPRTKRTKKIILI